MENPPDQQNQPPPPPPPPPQNQDSSEEQNDEEEKEEEEEDQEVCWRKMFFSSLSLYFGEGLRVGIHYLRAPICPNQQDAGRGGKGDDWSCWPDTF